MWEQLSAILWCQWRSLRNRILRNSFAAALGVALAILWYGAFVAGAMIDWTLFSGLPLSVLHRWLGAVLLLLLLLWQLMPIVTMSGGHALDLRRLQVYPVPSRTLLIGDAVLSVASGAEMGLLLLGIVAGLLSNQHLHSAGALWLLLYIPFNLFLSIGLHEIALNFARSPRGKGAGAILFVIIAVFPTLVAQMGWGHAAIRVVLVIANAPGTPWTSFAGASMGGWAVIVAVAWLLGAAWLAQWQLSRSTAKEESRSNAESGSRRAVLASALRRVLDVVPDPVSGLVEKELTALPRMPRFRFAFGLSCVLSPIVMGALNRGPKTALGQQSTFAAILVYALVIVSEALFWTPLSLDQSAAQVNFCFPIDAAVALRAKNIAALVFVLLQSCIITVLALVLRVSVTPMSFGSGLLLAATASLLFMAIGNYTAMLYPRAVNPRESFRKQSMGPGQIVLVVAGLLITALAVAAYLAAWAADSQWVGLGVLAIEFGLAAVAYFVAFDSAVHVARSRRETILSVISGR